MSAIKLPCSFTNPQHMSRLTIIFPMMLSGQCSLIWQYQSFMRDEHFVHMLQQIIVSSNGIKVPFTKFTMFGLTIFNTQIINIIAFIVVNLFSIMYHELRWSWFCILTSNTANNDRFSWAWWFYDTFALVEKFDLVFDINEKSTLQYFVMNMLKGFGTITSMEGNFFIILALSKLSFQ